jgi:hypothetical protein
MTEQITNEEYLKKAGKLSGAQAEYIFSRLRPKVGRGFEDNECFPVEEIALQLQLEDEALIEWRQRFAEVKEKASKQH